MRDGPDLGDLYRQARLRICALAPELDGETPVATCPGWTVADVLAHLVGVVEDVASGLLTGPPDEEETMAQVNRRRNTGVSEMVSDWSRMAPDFEKIVSAAQVWAAFLDVLSHEHDIRSASGHADRRQSDEMVVASRYLIEHLKPTQPLTVRMGDYQVRVGANHGSELTLAVSEFEAFRFRMGRRSTSQLRAMEWRGDPGPILPELTIFGPSEQDIIE